MKPKIPDDLLSAFLDREVTPEEDAQVRKHLQTSPQARQEFQDYQRLGELLHELPRKAAPTEFAAAVMQQAERETLIPLEEAPAGVAASQAVRSTRRGWLVAVVGMLATAAAVLIVVNLPARKDAVAIRDGVMPDVATRAAVAMRETTLDRGKMVASAPSSGMTPAMPVAVASKRMPPPARGRVSDVKVAAREKESLASSRNAAAPPPLAAAPMLTAAAKRPSMPEAGASRMVFPADLKSAKEGSVVEALESVGNQVAVVRLTLVNQTAGLSGLQSLLVRNASRPVRDDEKAKLMKERFSADKGSVVLDAKKIENGPGELICVYVEGSRDDLVGVLKDVQNESQFQHAQLTNAISQEKLAEYAQRPVTAANLAANETAAAAQSVVSLPHAAVNKILADTESPGEEESKQDQADPSARLRSMMSMVEQVPPTPAQKSAQAQKSARSKQKQAAPFSGKPLVAGTTQRSYQVFFVLDDQSVTGLPDKPAPSEAAAAAGEAEVVPGAPHVRPRTPVRARRPARKHAKP
jgi:hypothetical protein